MAYNGNGEYNLPSPQYPAITGNTITAEDFNILMADLAEALSVAFPRDGQGEMAGPIKNITELAMAAAGGFVSGAIDLGAEATAETKGPLETGTAVATLDFVRSLNQTALAANNLFLNANYGGL